MLRRGLYYFLQFFLVLPIIWLQNTGCWKEYSFEGSDSTQIQNPIPPTPSTPVPASNFPSCSSCKATDSLKLGQWSFKAGDDYLCGSVTSSGFMASNQLFTLFGPSSCSIDTGMVMNVYAPKPLNEDRFDISASLVDFYYYSRHNQAHIFNSRNSTNFSVSIQSYINTTSIAIGTFEGVVHRPNGDTVHIREGRFEIELR